MKGRVVTVFTKKRKLVSGKIIDLVFLESLIIDAILYTSMVGNLIGFDVLQFTI